MWSLVSSWIGHSSTCFNNFDSTLKGRILQKTCSRVLNFLFVCFCLYFEAGPHDVALPGLGMLM